MSHDIQWYAFSQLQIHKVYNEFVFTNANYTLQQSLKIAVTVESNCTDPQSRADNLYNIAVSLITS